MHLHRPFSFALGFILGFAGSSLADPIIVSDGPGHQSSPSQGHPSSIVTSDGPSTLAYQYPPKIITTDGPRQLAYEYPPKIRVTSGPSKYSGERSTRAGKIVVSDGPGMSKTPPESERSALAPAVASAHTPVHTLPPVVWHRPGKRHVSHHHKALASKLRNPTAGQSPEVALTKAP